MTNNAPNIKPTCLWCWANVGPIYYTQRSILIQCWVGLLVSCVAHIGPTLVQCWTSMSWENLLYIGPMSKITLGQHHLPTLAQCNWLHWPDVGIMLAHYLGMIWWVDPRCFFFKVVAFKFLRHKLNFLKDVGRSHVAVRIGCPFVTTRSFSMRNNLVCRRCTNWAN